MGWGFKALFISSSFFNLSITAMANKTPNTIKHPEAASAAVGHCDPWHEQNWILNINIIYRGMKDSNISSQNSLSYWTHNCLASSCMERSDLECLVMERILNIRRTNTLVISCFWSHIWIKAQMLILTQTCWGRWWCVYSSVLTAKTQRETFSELPLFISVFHVAINTHLKL